MSLLRRTITKASLGRALGLRSLRQRLSLVPVAVVLAVSLVAAFFVHQKARNELYESREQLARGLADNVAQHLTDQLSEVWDELASWSTFLAGPTAPAGFRVRRSRTGSRSGCRGSAIWRGRATTSLLSSMAIEESPRSTRWPSACRWRVRLERSPLSVATSPRCSAKQTTSGSVERSRIVSRPRCRGGRSPQSTSSTPAKRSRGRTTWCAAISWCSRCRSVNRTGGARAR